VPDSAGFVQDTIRLSNLTAQVGLRYDHATFPLSESQVEPRVGLAYYLPSTKTVFRASYNRIFITPEYNRAIPGVLKNAIDVASRPYGKSSFLDKPIGIISTSPGPLGGVSAAKHLQNIMPGIAGPILGQPETYLNGLGDAFDDKGALTKEPLQKVLQQYIDAFAAFIDKQNR